MTFAITTVLLVFVIAAPDAAWSRAVTIGLSAFLLAYSAATLRAATAVKAFLLAAALIVAALALAVVLAAAGDESPGRIATGLLLAGVPVLLARGVFRMVRAGHIALQAVLGALTIYLVVGLLFGFVQGSIGSLATAPFFGDQGTGNPSDFAYFSFATLTTTGFGDLAAATGAGRAVAMVEAIIGQVYLVTVIALLVGNMEHRRT